MVEYEKERFLLVEVDGEGMLVDVEGGEIFYLNETGLLIYKMLKLGKGEHEIKRRIVEEFDVSPEEVSRDVEAFKRVLNGKGII